MGNGRGAPSFAGTCDHYKSLCGSGFHLMRDSVEKYFLRLWGCEPLACDGMRILQNSHARLF
jgi:hypothetical protein